MDDMLVVQVCLQPGYAVITVAGEVDIATAPQLGHHLAALAGSGRPVIADLDQVSFIDAAGLRVLADAARQASKRGAFPGSAPSTWSGASETTTSSS